MPGYVSSHRRPRPLPSWLRELGPVTGNAAEHILESLRGVILAGNAAPGTELPIDEIAERFGVSRIPVREAFKTLTGEGLVDHQPRAGYTVARLTVDELRQFYLARQVLEAAVLLAAVQRATPADDERALAAHRALEQAVATGDWRAHHRHSREFHDALLAPSQMKRLMHMFASAWNVTEPMQPMAMLAPQDRATLHEDHQEMLDAFANRDVERLILASEKHHERLQLLIAAVAPGAAET